MFILIYTNLPLFQHACCSPSADRPALPGSENLSQALYLASSALEMGAEILVYPELFLSGFCYEPIDRFWERGTRAFEELDPFRALAKDSDCLIIGSVRGGRSNLGFCLDRTGLKLRPKIHPFGEEKKHFDGGIRSPHSHQVGPGGAGDLLRPALSRGGPLPCPAGC